MASRLADRFLVQTATTGTGTVTLGAAYSNGYLDSTEAALVNGAEYTWLITDVFTNGVPRDFELVRGVYTSSGTTAARTTVIVSKIAGTAGTSKINLSGDALVAVVADKTYLEAKASVGLAAAMALVLG